MKRGSVYGVAVLARLIGRTVMVRVDHAWQVEMTVRDARQVWGKVHLLVSPTHGTGEAWVDWDRTEIN